MTAKADFDATEWQTVVEGPAIAGLIVITSQRGGAVRESIAMGRAYVDAAKEHGHADLLGEIVERAPQLSPREFKSKEELRTEGTAKLREAVAVLEAKATPDEVEAYKRFVLAVAERAAEADKSGGVLGIGGERVTESESAVLDELAATLGIER